MKHTYCICPANFRQLQGPNQRKGKAFSKSNARVDDRYWQESSFKLYLSTETVTFLH